MSEKSIINNIVNCLLTNQLIQADQQQKAIDLLTTNWHEFHQEMFNPETVIKILNKSQSFINLIIEYKLDDFTITTVDQELKVINISSFLFYAILMICVEDVMKIPVSEDKIVEAIKIVINQLIGDRTPRMLEQQQVLENIKKSMLERQQVLEKIKKSFPQ